MKSSRNLLVGLWAFCVILFSTGCASRTIEAATTKVEVQQSKNKGFAISFPKELDATKLDVAIDPKTGEMHIKADRLKSSSTGIIESAGAAQAQSIANLTAAIAGILPLLVRAPGLEFPLPLVAPAPEAPAPIAPVPPPSAAVPPAPPVIFTLPPQPATPAPGPAPEPAVPPPAK